VRSGESFFFGTDTMRGCVGPEVVRGKGRVGQRDLGFGDREMGSNSLSLVWDLVEYLIQFRRPDIMNRENIWVLKNV
jgi:hypothetical protein